MVNKIVVLDKPFREAQEIITSVVEMKNKGPKSIDGKHLLSNIPQQYIERYQTIHAVRNNILAHFLDKT